MSSDKCQNSATSAGEDHLGHRRTARSFSSKITARTSFRGLVCSLALLGALCCAMGETYVQAHEGHHHDHHHDHDHDHDHDHHIHEEAAHTTKPDAQDPKSHGDHSHHHHEHEHREIPAEYDLDSLFPAHINKDDMNVKLVMWACKITRAHLLVEKFDALMKPLPRTAQALCSTLFISVVPIFLIYGLNMFFMRTKQQRERMTQYLISFAIGGLLGDVFFHTLPHMNSGGHDHHGNGHNHADQHAHEHHHDHGHSHGHDHAHDHSHGHAGEHSHHGHAHSHNPEETLNNFIVIVGIISFFLLEKVTQSLLGGGHNHSHGDHHHGQENKKNPQNRSKKAKVDEKDKGKSAADLEKEREKEIRYQSYAVISMVGDFIHNFTDGLSIGVAYVANYKMGVITTMAMLFHEIPHEVGDFALLFSLNYSICGILGLQLLTACGAMAGALVGSYMGTLYMNQCLAFTSGGFLYFAINGLMGELKEVQGVLRLSICIASIFLGLYFMYVFALFE